MIKIGSMSFVMSKDRNFICVEYEETNDIEVSHYNLLFIEFDKTLTR